MGFWCLVVARLPTDNQLCVQRMRGLITTYGMMTIAMWHKHCYNDYGNWTITALFCLFATAYYKTHCVEFLLAVCLFPKQNIFRGHLEVHKRKRKSFTHIHTRSLTHRHTMPDWRKMNKGSAVVCLEESAAYPCLTIVSTVNGSDQNWRGMCVCVQYIVQLKAHFRTIHTGDALFWCWWTLVLLWVVYRFTQGCTRVLGVGSGGGREREGGYTPTESATWQQHITILETHWHVPPTQMFLTICGWHCTTLCSILSLFAALVVARYSPLNCYPRCCPKEEVYILGSTD